MGLLEEMLERIVMLERRVADLEEDEVDIPPGKTWCVYSVFDPTNRSMFYIGITCDARRRLRAHYHDKSSAIYERLHEMKQLGVKAELHPLVWFEDERSARDQETVFIATNGGLLNRDIPIHRAKLRSMGTGPTIMPGSP